jgi:hypothetical protein
VCPGLAHRTVRCTREPNFELATFGNSGNRSAIIHRTVWCSTGLSGVPAEQRLLCANDRLQRTLNALQCAAARAEVRACTRRRTRQSTGPVEREMCPWAISKYSNINGYVLNYAKWWIKCKSIQRYDSRLSTLVTMCEREIVGNSPTLCGEGVKAWFIRLRVQPLTG